jgi:prepilin-type N-terminal cleavage/methylation domain-containing protein
MYIRSKFSQKKGLTLIELLIAISISTILSGVVIVMLNTSVEAYFYSRERMMLDKSLDACLEEVAGGGYDHYGIKDALEILSVSKNSITFVPLWSDEVYTPKTGHHEASLVKKTPFLLNRPVKAGTFTPIVEISRRSGRALWKEIPITYVPGENLDPLNPDDKIFLNDPLPPGHKIRFIYHPDVKNYSDCAMTIKWDNGRIVREYMGSEEIIPKYGTKGILLTGFCFQYLDNTNTEVLPKAGYIPDITAVKIGLNAQLEGSKLSKNNLVKEAFSFINIRNTRTQGRGIIIRQGTRMKIPDSQNIRVFSLANVVGVKANGMIEIEVRPQTGSRWKISIELGFDEEIPILKKYSVEYPAGSVVHSETINLTTDIPLNFLTLGGQGLYDYDLDEDIDDIVELTGDVELLVTRMDAKGAVVYIRP